MNRLIEFINHIIYSFNVARKEKYENAPKDFELFWDTFRIMVLGGWYRFYNPEDSKIQFQRQLDVVLGKTKEEID